MEIDFSILGNIDFTNKETLIFLAVVLIIATVVFFVVIKILVKIIKFIRIGFIRLFNLDVKKPEFNPKSTEWLHQPVTATVLMPKITEEVIVKIPEVKEKEEKQEEVKSFEEKEQKDIEESLEKLEDNEKTPLRAEDQESKDQEIKIPVPKHFSDEGKTVEEKEGKLALRGAQGKPEKNVVEIVGMGAKDKIMTASNIGGSAKVFAKQERSVTEPAHDFNYQVEAIGGEKESHRRSSKPEDQSIFEGKPEVSRIKLAHELRYDEKIWRDQKQVGLNMDRAEREELIKDIPKVYGRNISKSDLSQTVKKLGQKMIGTADAEEHAKLRKEIKFFKKIGGIK